MANLTLMEDDTKLTYESADGAVVIITKDADNLDVRQIIPNAVSKLTWQQLRDSISARVDV